MAYNLVLTPTVTTPPSGNPAITFEANGSQFFGPVDFTGRVVITFDPGCRVIDQTRFGVPGVNGNYLQRKRIVGRRPNLNVRYYGLDENAAELQYVTDMDQLIETSYTIDCMGQSYPYCNVIPETVRRSGAMRATGRQAGQCYFEVAMSFNQDRLAE